MAYHSPRAWQNYQDPANHYYADNHHHHHQQIPQSHHHQPQHQPTPLASHHHHHQHQQQHPYQPYPQQYQQYVPRVCYNPAADMAAATYPQSPPESYTTAPSPYFLQTSSSSPQIPQQSPILNRPEDHQPQMNIMRDSPNPDYYASTAADLYSRVQPPQQPLSSPPSPGTDSVSSQGGPGANHYPSSSGVRLPPILQVEKQQVTTSATQLASASRRTNAAHFVCPVPGCGSTFTRRFNLRGHLRSHTEERPYVCEWPGCKKGFARQHDCKRHQALHSAKSQNNLCRGCNKTFSRGDALNRHLRSEGGADCRLVHHKNAPNASSVAEPAELS